MRYSQYEEVKTLEEYRVNYICSEIDKEQCEIAQKRIFGYSLKDINKNVHKNVKKLF